MKVFGCVIGISAMLLQVGGAVAGVDLAALSIVDQQILGGSIPRGAQRVPVLEFSLAAPCGDPVTLTSIIVQHQGVGATTDITAIYLMGDGKRMTNPVVFSSSDGTATLRVPALLLKPCSKNGLSLHGDFSNDVLAMGEHRFYVKHVRYLAGGTERSATAVPPTAVRSRSVAGPATGSIFVHFLPLQRPVTFGANRVVARFTVEASSDSDQRIRKMMLTNNGSARGADLQNLYLRNPRGDRLTPHVTALDGDTVTMTFMPPLILKRSEKFLLELRADVRASKKRTIQFALEEPSDIDATPVRWR